MSTFANLRVTPIAWTQFDWSVSAELELGWEPDEAASDGENLAEFAGRACYESWDKPNPKTSTNEDYLKHILSVGHMSVLEHATVTLYLEGVSRSLTHELVRHRHFSYSQLSQRYVDSSDTEFIIPPELADDPDMVELFNEYQDTVLGYYNTVHDHTMNKLADDDSPRTEKRKRARQTARAVLPNSTETRIVVTGNYRAWRHFISMRATPGADREIRASAIAILDELKKLAPTVFGDFEIYEHTDGTAVAQTLYSTEV